MPITPHKLGIIGGTFNPVHMGHLRAAEEVGQKLALDEVLFIPAAVPPHKNSRPLADFKHRLTMVRAAIKGNPLFRDSDMEAQREGPSFTIDSLEILRKNYENKPLETYFIVGFEAFLDMPTWKDYTRLFDVTNFVVINRDGFDTDRIGRLLKNKVSPEFEFDADQTAHTRGDGRFIHYCQVSHLEISSTEIRRSIKNQDSIRYLVPDVVGNYIENNGLYR